jgi:hypothetical protein
LKAVEFQKSDGSVYYFNIHNNDLGFLKAFDNQHRLSITAKTNGYVTIGAGYVKGYYVTVSRDTEVNGYLFTRHDTVSEVDFIVDSVSTSDVYSLKGLKCKSKDTTKAGNLGNLVYDFSSSTITSTSDGINYNYYQFEDSGTKNIMYTGVAGMYDSSIRCTYTFNPGSPRQFSGTKNFLYSEDINLWIVACAIGFNDARFGNLNSFLPIKNQNNLELDFVNYYKNGVKTESYANSFVLDSKKYVVSKKEIRDIMGKTSSITFLYE